MVLDCSRDHTPLRVRRLCLRSGLFGGTGPSSKGQKIDIDILNCANAAAPLDRTWQHPCYLKLSGSTHHNQTCWIHEAIEKCIVVKLDLHQVFRCGTYDARMTTESMSSAWVARTTPTKYRRRLRNRPLFCCCMQEC